MLLLYIGLYVWAGITIGGLAYTSRGVHLGPLTLADWLVLISISLFWPLVLPFLIIGFLVG